LLPSRFRITKTKPKLRSSSNFNKALKINRKLHRKLCCRLAWKSLTKRSHSRLR
jgi:hypothetical protein